MTVKLGDRAIYYPRVPYGRQSELFCFVTRVADADKGIVDLVTFPAAGEFQHINNVMPKGEGIQIHCWAPREEQDTAPDNSELLGRIEILEFRLTAAESRLAAQQLTVYATQEAATEAQAEVKRGPGRPRKDAA
jgi:hypothetical protein